MKGTWEVGLLYIAYNTTTKSAFHQITRGGGVVYISKFTYFFDCCGNIDLEETQTPVVHTRRGKQKKREEIGEAEPLICRVTAPKTKDYTLLQLIQNVSSISDLQGGTRLCLFVFCIIFYEGLWRGN